MKIDPSKQPDEFLAAVRDGLDQNKKAVHIAGELEMSPSTLALWVAKLGYRLALCLIANETRAETKAA